MCIRDRLYYYHEAHWDDEVGFILMDTLIAVPMRLCEPCQVQELLEFAQSMLRRDNLELQAAALRFLQYLSGFSHLYRSQQRQIMQMVSQLPVLQLSLIHI